MILLIGIDALTCRPSKPMRHSTWKCPRSVEKLNECPFFNMRVVAISKRAVALSRLHPGGFLPVQFDFPDKSPFSHVDGRWRWFLGVPGHLEQFAGKAI